jgi:hypothetical protein
VNCPLELRKRYHEGRVIPFIGAGASMSVRWESGGKPQRGPSWGELVDRATVLLGFDDPALARVRGSDLQILEYFKRKHGQQTAKLTNWLSKLMDPPDDALSKSRLHRELAALDRCSLFYTTNYDTFLERSFRLFGRDSSTVVLESQMGGPDHGCEIIKFHGDLDHPDQIVLTESDFEKRLSLSTALDQRLRADLLGRVILFIGYSFRDPNVSYLFRLFTDHFYDKVGTLAGDRAYILVADPSDFEEELFKARRIHVIGVDGAHISEDIADLLAEMRG